MTAAASHSQSLIDPNPRQPAINTDLISDDPNNTAIQPITAKAGTTHTNTTTTTTNAAEAHVSLSLLQRPNETVADTSGSSDAENQDDHHNRDGGGGGGGAGGTNADITDKKDIPEEERDAVRKPSDEPHAVYGPILHLPPPFSWKTHLTYWNVKDDNYFWLMYGKAVAYKNLYISIGNLCLGFAIWLLWSVVIVLISDIHKHNPKVYAFSSWKSNMTDDEYSTALWLLPAIAGMSGATTRLTNSFMIAIAGGRNVISQTSLLLLLPMILLASALNQKDVSLEYLIVIALLTGVGGGAFASSMSNISFFFRKKEQGLALGLNAGIGNLGVSLMQGIIPAMVTYQAFGKGAATKYETEFGSKYIANAALFWVPFLVIFIILAWMFMNSLPQHKPAAKTPMALFGFYWLEFLGFVGSGICCMILITTRTYFASPPGLGIVQAFILWFIAVVVVVLCMKYLMFFKFAAAARQNIHGQLQILKLKHTWVMTYLYTMTFGSFIGFSASFPKLILDIFDIDPLPYAWLGAFVGSLVRPIGGLLSDKYGGARITHWNVVLMVVCTVAVGIVLLFAKESDDPKELFPAFLILFLVLFITTGIGNGSTFRMVPIIFQANPEQAGPVLGWTSAIAAYGAFIIPIIFGTSITLGAPEWAMFGFAIWYASCLVVNWWYYYRKGAEIPC